MVAKNLKSRKKERKKEGRHIQNHALKTINGVKRVIIPLKNIHDKYFRSAFTINGVQLISSF